MDQHPIPQDVTGFQFKLIGTMTVKQFGYVASGVITAVVLYYLPLPGLFGILIKIFFIPLFGGSGAFIAFVPIEGRPVDVMATNFFKAIFSPNQYVYRKSGRQFSFSTLSLAKVVPTSDGSVAKQSTTASVKQKEVDKKGAQLQAYLRSAHNEVKNSLDQKEAAMLSSLALPAAPRSAPITALPASKPHPAGPPTLPVRPPVQPKPEEEKSLNQEETVLEQQLQTAKQEETTTHAPAAHQKVTTLEQQLEEVHAQKKQLEQELLVLKNQLITQPIQPQPVPAVTMPAAGVPASQYAQTISQPITKRADLPNISDTPNVVVGIVKDPRGNILPNMLVEVKDKDGNPVRAFKTNPLGQFASATPLANGMYTIELDDPKKKHTFDAIQITAGNQIMLPIEIISHDAREELRKQLFN